MSYIDKAIYMLKKWIDWAVKDLHTCHNRPDLMYYGSGYNGWGIQTHQKSLAAFAVIATNNKIDTSDMEASREALLDYSIKMFKFMLESHIEGSYECMDGYKWGHTWISVLGTERVMHAIEELMPYVTDEDKRLFEKIMISEADWLFDHYEISAAPTNDSGKNHPESNIWNGIFLHRVASMFPKCARAYDYKNKGTAFLVNGISLPDDKRSDVAYDGKLVSDWHVGNNYYDTYALDHHGYLNVGYMAICTSNIAMWHFSCKKLSLNPSEALYHNVEGLWKLIKSCIADDGRLIRIGGDTRVRYCYCQDYMLPSLMLARDKLGDKDARKFEQLLVNLFYKEFSSNGDGSFLSDRCKGFNEISPIYYTRLETDKAATLSMLVNWNNISDEGSKEIETLPSWTAPSHGSCMVRDKNRFASWTFYGGEGMTGLCLPPQNGDLTEWKDNLAADIRGCGSFNTTQVLSHKEVMFKGGFFASGEVNRFSRVLLAEQQKDEITATEHVIFTALPDGATVVVMQYAVAPNRIYYKTIKGINYNIPNDLFNDFSRAYYFENGSINASRFTGIEKCINLKSRWVNVDNKIGIIAGYNNKTLNLYQPGNRQICIKGWGGSDNLHNSYTGNLNCDVICTKLKTKPHWAEKQEVILNTSAIVISGVSVEDTKRISGFDSSNIVIEADTCIQKVITMGMDGKVYIVLSNPSDRTEIAKINVKACNLLTGQIINNRISIKPKSGGVFVL